MLGGAKYMLVGNLIAQQFGTSRDWAFGAAISIGLSLLTLGSLYFYTVKAQKTSTAN
jgi:spermidine/putrescine transport system permease protein